MSDRLAMSITAVFAAVPIVVSLSMILYVTAQAPITRDFRVDYATGMVTMIVCEQATPAPGSTPMPPEGRMRDVRVDFSSGAVMSITCTNPQLWPAYMPAARKGQR